MGGELAELKQRTTHLINLINEIRKASEIHDKEKKEELGLVRKMYAAPPPAPAA